MAIFFYFSIETNTSYIIVQFNDRCSHHLTCLLNLTWKFLNSQTVLDKYVIKIYFWHEESVSAPIQFVCGLKCDKLRKYSSYAYWLLKAKKLHETILICQNLVQGQSDTKRITTLFQSEKKRSKPDKKHRENYLSVSS